MTPAPDKTTTSQRSIFDLLPAGDLPALPDATDAADLITALNISAAYYRQCSAAFQAIATLPDAERRSANARAVANFARLGMSAARALQEQAKGRLTHLDAYPDEWTAWPSHPAPAGPQPG